MEATMLARELLESVPANELIGIQVRTACDGAAEVGVQLRPELSNVIGSMHASGLIALTDATGLAALISAAEAPRQVQDVVPLGSDADLTFFKPAKGNLIARCTLDDSARQLAERLFRGDTDRVALMTETEIVDASGDVVCTGRFRWRVRRPVPVGA